MFCIREWGKPVFLNFCCCISCDNCYNELRVGQEERARLMFPQEERLRHPPGGPVVMKPAVSQGKRITRSIPATQASLRLPDVNQPVRASSKGANPMMGLKTTLLTSFGHCGVSVWKACWISLDLRRYKIRQQLWRSKDHRTFVTFVLHDKRLWSESKNTLCYYCTQLFCATGIN